MSERSPFEDLLQKPGSGDNRYGKISNLLFLLAAGFLTVRLLAFYLFGVNIMGRFFHSVDGALLMVVKMGIPLICVVGIVYALLSFRRKEPNRALKMIGLIGNLFLLMILFLPFVISMLI